MHQNGTNRFQFGTTRAISGGYITPTKPNRAFIGAFKEHNIVVKKIIILFAFTQLASTKSSISADILDKCISTQNTLLQ